VVARSPSPGNETKIKETDEHIEDTPDTESLKAQKDKFFIVKSLTVEDLELSVRNGIWTTQSHNEDSLNKAYQVRTSIFLGDILKLTRIALDRLLTMFISSFLRTNRENTLAMQK
jgi:hypothetical protein